MPAHKSAMAGVLCPEGTSWQPVLTSCAWASPTDVDFRRGRRFPCKALAAASQRDVGFKGRRSCLCKALAVAGLAASLLLLSLAAAAHLAPAQHGGFAAREALKEDVEVAGGLLQCSGVGDDCGATKCCTITGYKCYEKSKMFAGCLESCPPPNDPAWSCARPANLKKLKPSKASPGTKLFCFQIMSSDKGLQETNWDISLVRTQLRMRASIFGCEDWIVFSDVSTWLSPGPPEKLMTYVVDAPHTRRTLSGMWLNTPTFLNVWIAIRKDGRWARNDWAVKVDPDTVFLPALLRAKLAVQEVTDSGIYITNCKGVQYGFFGSLEVMSRTAFATLIENVEDCNSTLTWNRTGSEWAEDLFAQRCMDLHGVDNIEDFTLISDGVCDAIGIQGKQDLEELPNILPPCTQPAPGLHPFRTPQLYFTCLAQAQQSQGASPDAQGRFPLSRKDHWMSAAHVAVQEVMTKANAAGFDITPPELTFGLQASDGVTAVLFAQGSDGPSCTAVVTARTTNHLTGLDTLQIRKLEVTDVTMDGLSDYVFTFSIEASVVVFYAVGKGSGDASCHAGKVRLRRHVDISMRKQAGSLSVTQANIHAYASMKVLFLDYRLNRFVISDVRLQTSGGEPAACNAGSLQELCSRLGWRLGERIAALLEDPAFRQHVASALERGLNSQLPLDIS